MDNMEVQNKSEEEIWQEEEDERLEYEGYCQKIRQGLENQESNTGIRAIWELVQNARDMSKNAEIKMELTPTSFIFSHHGQPFDYTSFRALVKQDSSKDRRDANLVGQYGTGFMTTHIFNRLVYVSAPYAVKKSKEEISGYYQIRNFPLDRTKVDSEEGPSVMKGQLKKVREFCKMPLLSQITDDTTSFRYDLTENQATELSCYLERVIRLIPFVLVLNDTITKIEINDHHTARHYSFKKSGEGTVSKLEKEGWQEVVENVMLTNCSTWKEERISCKSLKSDKGDVVIIPPYPTSCGDVETIPSLFLWFPLLGTEKFGVNFIFHSKRFYPVEKRNNIMIPGTSQISKEKGGDNEAILKEMMQVVFSYYAQVEHAKELGIDMCRVAFPENYENEDTQRFYRELQQLWSQQIVSWKVLPIGNEYHSVDENRVKLLHPNFYSLLNDEKRRSYEPVMAQYASTVNDSEGQPAMIPANHLIEWSEIVNRWGCGRDTEFFMTVTDVCKAIKNNGNELHSFLMLMKESGNSKVMDEYPLLPNREGKLYKRLDLYYGEFLTDDVYQLVKEVMGDKADKMYAPSFLDVCLVNDYSTIGLQKDIAYTMNIWRNKTLSTNPSVELNDDELNALIQFCSATHLSEFKNQRGRIMPLIAQFYGKDFRVVPTIKYRDDEEEEFYKPAFNLLLDYTLSRVSLKDAEWVNSHKQWLLSFLQEYAPQDNDDRKKKLDTYGVLPNQKGDLCLKNDLKANKGVPDEMVAIYLAVFETDLRGDWIDSEFESIINLTPVYPKEIASKIEEVLVRDMKKEDKNERLFEKVVRNIILKVGKSEDWKNWFSIIDDKKATYTFNMKTGKAQESLFSLMDNLDDDSLERLAKLGENGDIGGLISKMEKIELQEKESTARFNHLHTIGKHIEDVLRGRIGRDLVETVMPETKDDVITADDIQDGQDIIVRVKVNGEWKEIYYVEVKSKWDFNDPAHMSTSQIKMASRHPDEYALCCVDLRPYKDQDLAKLSEEVIIGSTKVKMKIGSELSLMVSNILEADRRPDQIQMKISDYRSNISAGVFEQGVPFQELIDKIDGIARRELYGG